MINHLSLEQVEIIRNICLNCECWIPSRTPGFKTCKKYHTDSKVFLAELCEKVKQMLNIEE